MTTSARPGHHWKEADRVRWYVERMDRRAEERRPQLELLTRLIPFERDEAIRVLDVGAGYGAVSAALLTEYPRASALLFDLSDEMIRVGRVRLAEFGDRFSYVQGDFADGVLPPEAGSGYHAIVSSLAIHHLPAEGKQTLYRDIAARLLPGGCFLNLDVVGAPDEALSAVYDRVSAIERPMTPEPAPPPTVQPRYSVRQPLADHLTWLTDAGLVNVDCFWKRLENALFGGFKPLE